MKQLILLSLIFTAQLQSQSLQTISGKVVDQETMEPLAYATILIYRDNEMINAIPADTAGVFKWEPLALGQYKMISTYLGYKSDTMDFEIPGLTSSLDIYLKEQPFSITCVEITSYGSMHTGCCTLRGRIGIEESDSLKYEQFKSRIDFSFDKPLSYCFPNPTYDVLKMNFPDEVSRIGLYDMSGRVLMKKNVSNNYSEFHLGELVPGTYFVLFSNEKKVVHSEKVVVVR